MAEVQQAAYLPCGLVQLLLRRLGYLLPLGFHLNLMITFPREMDQVFPGMETPWVLLSQILCSLWSLQVLQLGIQGLFAEWDLLWARPVPTSMLGACSSMPTSILGAWVKYKTQKHLAQLRGRICNHAPNCHLNMCSVYTLPCAMEELGIHLSIHLFTNSSPEDLLCVRRCARCFICIINFPG